MLKTVLGGAAGRYSDSIGPRGPLCEGARPDVYGSRVMELSAVPVESYLALTPGDGNRHCSGNENSADAG